MRLIKDVFLIRANKNMNKSIIIGGKTLTVDTDFEKYRHATQVGEIAFSPKIIDKEYLYNTPLNDGDKIVCHHFVCQPDNLISINNEEFYQCEYYNIWAKIEGEKIKPLEDFIFVEPILEPESNLYSGSLQVKREREYLKNQGIVFALSKSARAAGLKMGDRIFFTNNADYDIRLLDKNLYRMRIRNIIGVEREGELVCLNDKILVKEINSEKKVNGLLYAENKREKTGEVKLVGDGITEIRRGEIVSYFNGLSSSLTYKNIQYAFITEDQINYKLQ
jgi:co-chaperonin GroES (HSP10)